MTITDEEYDKLRREVDSNNRHYLRNFILTYVLFFILVFTLGWASNSLYKAWDNERTVNGFYAQNMNKTQLEYAKTRVDSAGDWICINTLKMTYQEAFDTCLHECGHASFTEIFAENCENNISKCKELLK